MIALVSSAIAFSVLGLAGAVGAFVLFGGANCFTKYRSGRNAELEINEGDYSIVAKYLPSADRKIYLAEIARQKGQTYEQLVAQQPNGVQVASQPNIQQYPVTVQPAQQTVTDPNEARHHLHHHTIEVMANPIDIPHNSSEDINSATISDTPHNSPEDINSANASPNANSAVDTSMNMPDMNIPAPTVVQVLKQQLVQHDTARRIANMGPMSLLWVGASGTAKSLTATTALKFLKVDDPTLQIWIISAKCQKEESGYRTGFDRWSMYDFLKCSDEFKHQAFEEWYEIIEDYKVDEGKGILLFDELSLIMTYSSRIKHQAARRFRDCFEMLMIGFSSAGRSSGKAVWGITPNGALNALGGLTKAQLGAFNSVFNAQLSTSNAGFHYGTFTDASKNGMAPNHPPTDADEQAAVDAGCTLLTGFNGRWYPTIRYSLPPEDPAIIAKFKSDRGPYARTPKQNATPPPIAPRTSLTRPTAPIPTADMVPPPTPPTVSEGLADQRLIGHPTETTDANGHIEPTAPPSFDLGTYTEHERLVMADGIRQGLSQNQIMQNLGVKPGGSAAYLRFKDLYDNLIKLRDDYRKGEQTKINKKGDV